MMLVATRTVRVFHQLRRSSTCAYTETLRLFNTKDRDRLLLLETTKSHSPENLSPHLEAAH